MSTGLNLSEEQKYGETSHRQGNDPSYGSGRLSIYLTVTDDNDYQPKDAKQV